MFKGLALLVGILVLVGATIVFRRVAATRASERAAEEEATRRGALSMGEIVAESRRIAPLLAAVIEEVGNGLKPGMTTRDVNRSIAKGLERHNLQPAMRGYNGFPSESAISVNEQVLHALPSDRVLKTGDLVTIQSAAFSDTAFANAGRTFALGDLDDEKSSLLQTTSEAMRAALAEMQTGRRAGDVGSAIQETVESAGFAVVRDYVGYAMGHSMITGAPAAWLRTKGKRGKTQGWNHLQRARHRSGRCVQYDGCRGRMVREHRGWKASGVAHSDGDRRGRFP